MKTPNKHLTAYMAKLTPKQKAAMAAALGVTEKYLSHLCYGFRKASVVDTDNRKALVPRLCRYTGWKLTPWMLRPDVYGKSDGIPAKVAERLGREPPPTRPTPAQA